MFAFVASHLVRNLARYAAGSGISEIKCILAGFVMQGFLGFATFFIKSITLVRSSLKETSRALIYCTSHSLLLLRPGCLLGKRDLPCTLHVVLVHLWPDSSKISLAVKVSIASVCYMKMINVLTDFPQQVKCVKSSPQRVLLVSPLLLVPRSEAYCSL